MGREREPSIRRIFREANDRNEKPTEAGFLTREIYDSVAGLFKNRCEFDETDKKGRRIKPLGPFHYSENDSDNSPFHSVMVSPIHDHVHGINPSYYFLIDIQEDGSTEMKRLFSVHSIRLEDPFGRVIGNVGALKKYESVIKKIVKDGNRHLPTNHPLKP